MAATIGANIKVGTSMRLKQKLFTLLGAGYRQLGRSTSACPIYTKAGVPASDTAADDPGQAPAFIIDTTNSKVYFCHTWVSSSSFTLVKLAA